MNPAIHAALDVVGITVVAASILANFILPTSVLGKCVHFLALNWALLSGHPRD